MKRTLIRYRTKPEMADTNAALIAAVFAELKAAEPEGVRYLSLRLEDDTFVHFVETEADAGSAVPGLAAFKAFRAAFANVVSSRRRPEVLSSSAIIACWMSRESRNCRRRMTEIPASSAGNRRPQRPSGCDAAEAASLLRAHDRLGDRRRGRAAGCADQGGGIVCLRRSDRQSRGLAVPDRAQHRAGFPAPPHRQAGAALGARR